MATLGIKCLFLGLTELEEYMIKEKVNMIDTSGGTEHIVMETYSFMSDVKDELFKSCIITSFPSECGNLLCIQRIIKGGK